VGGRVRPRASRRQGRPRVADGGGPRRRLSRLGAPAQRLPDRRGRGDPLLDECAGRHLGDPSWRQRAAHQFHVAVGLKGGRMVTDVTPYYRELGAGPGVVCVHANASSSGQWRALMELLAPRFHVLAPDCYGAGKSPPRPRDRPSRLRDEVALLEPVFARAGDPFALVGHSYGAAGALIAALAQPKRVRALVLYEPTLFSLVEAESPRDVDGIRNTVVASLAALAAGDPPGAARAFIDFWM